MGTWKELHPNTKALIGMVDGFNRRDEEAVRRFVSEEVVFTIYGRGPQAGVYRGIEGIHRVLGRASELGLTSNPFLFVEEGEYLFVAAKITGNREGKSLETENCYLYRFRDGKIVEWRNIPTDQYAFDDYCR